MFWKRKEEVVRVMAGISITPPTKRQFETMLELLSDAEKYDTGGEIKVSKKILTDLCEYIETYCGEKPK